MCALLASTILRYGILDITSLRAGSCHRISSYCLDMHIYLNYMNEYLSLPDLRIPQDCGALETSVTI
jgi:hypothetical protein